jgi:hypothetical protein
MRGTNHHLPLEHIWGCSAMLTRVRPITVTRWRLAGLWLFGIAVDTLLRTLELLELQRAAQPGVLPLPPARMQSATTIKLGNSASMKHPETSSIARSRKIQTRKSPIQ